MDAIEAAAGYHFSFHIVPVRMDANGEPYRDDLAQFNDCI
jgi:hypothetical protein